MHSVKFMSVCTGAGSWVASLAQQVRLPGVLAAATAVVGLQFAVPAAIGCANHRMTLSPNTRVAVRYIEMLHAETAGPFIGIPGSCMPINPWQRCAEIALCSIP